MSSSTSTVSKRPHTARGKTPTRRSSIGSIGSNNSSASSLVSPRSTTAKPKPKPKPKDITPPPQPEAEPVPEPVPEPIVIQMSDETKLSSVDLSDNGQAGTVLEVLVLSKIENINESIKQRFGFNEWNVISGQDRRLLWRGIVNYKEDLENLAAKNAIDVKPEVDPTAIRAALSRSLSSSSVTSLGRGKDMASPAKNSVEICGLIELKNQVQQQLDLSAHSTRIKLQRYMLPAQVAVPVGSENVYLSFTLPRNIDDIDDVDVAVSRAHVIVADPDLIIPQIYEAPCLKWLHSTRAEVEQIVRAIKSVKEHHEIKRQEYWNMKQRLELETKNIEDKQKEFQAQLAARTPLLREATLRVESIQKAELDEVRAMKHPPEPVKVCLEAMVFLLGHQNVKDWNEVLKIVCDIDFKPTVLAFTAYDMTEAHHKAFLEKFTKNPHFAYDKMGRASAVCGSMARWMMAQLQVVEATEFLKPLLAELAVLKAGHKKSVAEANYLEAKLSQHADEINISLTHSSGFGPHVAEFCMSQIISRERSAGLPLRPEDQQIRPKYRLLNEVTVGILGGGDVGTFVSNKLQAFGCQAKILKRRNPDAEAKNANVHYFDPSNAQQSLNAFLQGCDYLINCLPSTSETHHMLNTINTSSLKNAVLIDVARGDVIEDSVLLQALENNILSAAVLDASNRQSMQADHAFWTHSKITLVPYVSGYPKASIVIEGFVSNVSSYAAKQPLTHAVDLELGY